MFLGQNEEEIFRGEIALASLASGKRVHIDTEFMEGVKKNVLDICKSANLSHPPPLTHGQLFSTFFASLLKWPKTYNFAKIKLFLQLKKNVC